jgi:hypothetical protein
MIRMWIVRLISVGAQIYFLQNDLASGHPFASHKSTRYVSPIVMQDLKDPSGVVDFGITGNSVLCAGNQIECSRGHQRGTFVIKPNPFILVPANVFHRLARGQVVDYDLLHEDNAAPKRECCRTTFISYNRLGIEKVESDHQCGRDARLKGRRVSLVDAGQFGADGWNVVQIPAEFDTVVHNTHVHPSPFACEISLFGYIGLTSRLDKGVIGKPDSYNCENYNDQVNPILSPPVSLFGASMLFLCGVALAYEGLISSAPAMVLLAGFFSKVRSVVIAFQ